MAEPRSQDGVQSTPPEKLVESTLHYVAERLRERPDLAVEVLKSVDATLSRVQQNPNASFADTIAIRVGSHPTPRISEAGSQEFGRFGDYELIQEIARGGMGVVFKARQVSLDRIVALKMILSGQLAHADDIRRFRTEAQAAANLDHPGIVPIFEIGEFAGQHFYSMGFIEGRSLADELREGPIEPHKAARYTRKVAEAIAFAHQRGVIHRDLKPGNVLVDASGEPKVTDFGLAKRTHADSELTGIGHVLGTPAYMPPEQASGRIDLVKESADVYSLGAMLYCLVTGRPPFQAANPIDTLLQVIHREPIPLRQFDSSLPKDLDTICLKCLRKDPGLRYASAQDLADDLECWLQGEPIRARPVGRVEKAWMWCKRQPVIASLAAFIVLGSIMGSAIFWERQNAALASGLVESLAKSEPSQIPLLIEELDRVRWWAEPKLRQQLISTGESLTAKRTRLHAQMALVGRDSSLVAPLREEMLENHVSYVGPIRSILSPFASELRADLDAILHNPSEDTDDDRRFRAAIALAEYVPVSETNAWSESDLQFVAQELVTYNAEFQPLLREALRPVHKQLIPYLERIFSDVAATDLQRTSAANAIADYAAEDRVLLTQLLTLATPEQHAILYPLVSEAITPERISELAEIAAMLPSTDLGSLPRIALGQQRANAAVTLLRLGEREEVLPVFDWSDDPEALTQFIFRCQPREIAVEDLLDLLDKVGEDSAQKFPRDMRYALLLAISEYDPTEIPEERRQALVDRLADWYANDPSSGVHAASGWLLRHLKQQDIAERIEQTPVPYSADREWFTLEIEVQPTKPDGVFSILQTVPQRETFYFTFIVFPEGDYQIGSHDDEPIRGQDELRHSVKFTRRSAILDREVTMAELIAVSPAFAKLLRQFDADPTSAGFGADWYDSVAFCRWLGNQMGLDETDQAYANPMSLNRMKYPREPVPAASWAPRDWPLDLNRRGFRLPTEAEWEVAARSGSRASFGYGSDTSLLKRFAWYQENSGKRMHPTRELYPNIRGLFDMHGNVFEWTHDWYSRYSTGMATDPLSSIGGSGRVGRGGGWSFEAPICRSAFRDGSAPSDRDNNCGFRLALSLSPFDGRTESLANP